jgi:flavin reductase (DIM6/NTAB) family NADH-FMN oxidoreductase RutF
MESRKEATSSQVDAKTFWRTLSERVTGVTIVTARDESGPAGLLALSAAHVTADPPTVLVSVDKKTSALATILSSRHFAVNYLPAGTEAVADAFSGKDFRDPTASSKVNGTRSPPEHRCSKRLSVHLTA